MVPLNTNDNGDTNAARQLRIEALRIHKELIDRYDLNEVGRSSGT
jgi:hypothetical protein